MSGVQTHKRISNRLCGDVEDVESGVSATVLLHTTEEMAVDDRGLVHGGFCFGAADYAAMVAINDPNVVLGSSSCSFLKPVVVGDKLVARASVEAGSSTGKKRSVKVSIQRDGDEVFSGTFTCFVLPQHVLDQPQKL
ncbi:Methylthioribose-1-phosphate isomerase [Diplonema papillatum]|nr:Methylthioribose-1-phosphate isomerase [Diplonema papillatum]